MLSKLNPDHLSKLKLILVSHVTEAYGPVQALKEYLCKNSSEFSLIIHPMYNYSGASSYQTILHGKKSCEHSVKLPRIPQFFHYFLSYFLTLGFVLQSKKRYDLYVGIDNLNAMAGLFLKKIGLVDKVVFYIADYTENRFKTALVNVLYNAITRFSARQADMIWSITRRAADRLEKQGALKERIIVVPNGVNINKIPSNEGRHDSDVKRFIFVGHLTQTKGVEAVVKVFPDILKKYQNVTFSIVGSGPYKKQLNDLIVSLNLTDYVKLVGYIDHNEILKFMTQFDVGLAPYTCYDDYVRYCDPVKVKEYLACGCSVIISDVPEIASKIAEQHAGFVYTNNEELEQSILSLLRDNKVLNEFRQNAVRLSKEYDWTNIFDVSFYLTVG